MDPMIPVARTASEASSACGSLMAPPSPNSPGTAPWISVISESRSAGLSASTDPATENPTASAANTANTAWYDMPAARIGPPAAP
ncbi:hypothetical protein CMMCAS05_05755 [Clavibacter michiganensis subsp. michiganensis]|nr:hypothetical protein CMMCAS05_05755 [Clavibacter michiganensis subsp. michiganensis]